MMPGSRGEKLLYSMTLAANLVSLYICNCRSSLMVVMIVTPVLLLIHRRYRWAAVDLVASPGRDAVVEGGAGAFPAHGGKRP